MPNYTVDRVIDGKLKIIAEIGSMHDGSLGNAMKAAEAAAECGADVVKFQTHVAAAETLPDAPMPPYFQGEPRLAYFERTAFSESQWQQLARHCESLHVEFLSSPFCLEAVDILEHVGVKAYKIPSGEVTNIPLLEKIARTGKPTYLSSGMSDWAELDRAVKTLRADVPLVVMQCSSIYPCPSDSVGLNLIDEMMKRYGLPAGLSDHTLGFGACIAAAALGATAIEKHFTLSRRMYVSDAANSMEPEDFSLLVRSLREVKEIISNPVDKNQISKFKEMKIIFEKSIVTSRIVPSGHRLEIDDLAFKKPGDGIGAAHYRELIGKTTVCELPANTKIKWSDLL